MASFDISRRRSLRLSRTSDGNSTNPYPFAPPNNFDVESDDEQADDIHEKLSELLINTWKLFIVSPLFNFSRDNETIEKCELKIKQELISLKKKNTTYSISIENLPDLTSSENDEEALKIQILSKLNRKVTKFYEGVFLSWRNKSNTNSVDRTLVNLPLLFCSGSVSNINTTHTILAKILDCSFSKFTFTQFDFKWLSCIALKFFSKEQKFVTFVFCRPDKKNYTINFKMSFKSLKLLWDTILQDEKITYGNVNKLFAALHEHFLNTYATDLNYFILKTITISKGLMINHQGKIRIHSALLLDSLLKYFNKVCSSRRPWSKRKNSSND